jgi:type IV secretion system protein VirD4
MFDTKIPFNNRGKFATVQEINKETKIVDYEKEMGNASGVTVSTDGRTAKVYDDDGFYMVVGGTGSKKTRDVVAPYILNNAIAGSSMIISDVKGDLYKLLSVRLKKMGYRLVCLDFNNPGRGDAYNPLWPLYRDYNNGKSDRANKRLRDLSETIFSSVSSDKDPFWHTSSGEYFIGLSTTLLKHFDEKDATIANVINLHIQGNKKMGHDSYFKSFFAGKEDTDEWKLIANTIEAPNETRGSINSVFITALNKIIGQNKGLIKMMSHSTFEISDLIDEKVAVFIIANEESLSVHGGLISALINQWYGMLVDIAEESDNGILKRKVAFVLDEMGNLPAIPSFEIKTSLCRARGIAIFFVVQSFAQIYLRYGDYVANTIIANTTNWIYLHSPDPKLNEYVSGLTGIVTDEVGRSRPLISADELRYLKKYTNEGLTECLMLLGRMHPIICHLRDISEYYGIEPIEKLDIPFREDEEVSDVDFCSIVKNEMKAHLQAIINNSDKEKEDIDDDKDTLKGENLRGITEIIDGAIDELIGG